MSNFAIAVLFICLAFSPTIAQALYCGDDLTYCGGTGAYCCGLDNADCCWEAVYSFWWFWFIWFWVFFLIIACSIWICVRRRRRYQPVQYMVVDSHQPAYGTVQPVHGIVQPAHPYSQPATAPPSYQAKPPPYTPTGN